MTEMYAMPIDDIYLDLKESVNWDEWDEATPLFDTTSSKLQQLLLSSGARFLAASMAQPPFKERSRFSERISESVYQQIQQRHHQCQQPLPLPPQQAVDLFHWSVQLGLTTIAPLIAALAGWLGARNSRRIKVKFREIEIEARTSEEIQNALSVIKQYELNNDRQKVLDLLAGSDK